MSRKVVIVNASRKTPTLHLPIGIGCILSSLIKNSIDFEFIDLVTVPYEKRHEVFQEKLSTISAPSIFGFSIIAGNGHIAEVEHLASMVRKSGDGHTIVYGGPLPSSVPELCLKNTFADYVIAGEGEESFPIFLKQLESRQFDDVPGLAYWDGESIVVNKKKRVQDLDSYNPPPYDCFDMDFYNGYLKKTGRCFEISGSRGCRGACSFCFRFSGPGLTSRSGENIFNEVRHISEKYGINKFNFTDENFLEQKESFYGFLSLLDKAGLNIKFRGQTRVDEIDENFCASLSERGLMSINFGIESADQDILKKISKGITIEDIEKKIALMRRYGIEVFASIIIGFPWETKETVESARNFIVRNNLQGHCTINYLAPLPATRLYKDALKKNLIVDEWKYIYDMGFLYQDRCINMTSLSDGEIGNYYEDLLQLGEPATATVDKTFTGILMDGSIK